MRKQLPALTSLRGIAAVFILLHHICIYFFPEIGKNAKQLTPFLRKSYLWVDFFFMLSGYILAHVYRDTFKDTFWTQKYKIFIVSRFTRIYPLHLIILSCFICLAFFQFSFQIGLGFSGKQSILSLLTNFTLLQALHHSSWNEPAWAISAEWLLYFLIPLIIWILERTNRFVDIATIFVSFLSLFIMNRVIGNLDFDGWNSLLRCGAEMLIGVLLYKYQSRALWNRYFTDSNFAVGLLLIALISISLPINHTITVCIFPFLIISASNLSGNSVLNSSSLIYLGTISYSIYMVHWLIMVLIDTTSSFLTGNALHNNLSLLQLLPLSAVFISFIILIASLSYSYVELPLRSWLKKKLLRRSH